MKSRLVLAVAVLALVVVPAAIARTTLQVAPDPVVWGQTFTLSGDGYPQTSISFEVTGPRKSGIHYFTGAEPIPDGSYSADWLAYWTVGGEPALGDYQITSYYLDTKGGRKKGAVVKFSVVAP